MDLSSILHLVESACQAFAQDPSTHADAERFLAEFRSSPSPYLAAIHVIEHSSSPAAKFQALITIRDAAIREWVSLSPAMRRDLLHFLLRLAITECDGDESSRGLVRRQAASAGASLFKRIWGEPSSDERRAILHLQAETAAIDVCRPRGDRALMDLLNAIVLEFSATTASNMGLPWDYHEMCRHQLQEEFLLGFLQLASNTAGKTAGMALTGNDGGGCAAALTLLSSLLSWDSVSSWDAASYSLRAGALAIEQFHYQIAVRPPVSWRIVLLNDTGLSWLPQITNGLRGLIRSPYVVALGRAIRQVMVQLCGMAGALFDSSNGSGLTMSRGRHLHRLFALLLPDVQIFLHNPPMIIQEDEVLLDVCRAFHAAANAHGVQGFLDAGNEGGIKGIFDMLSQLTVAVTRQKDLIAHDIEDILLEMWTELCVMSQCIGPKGATSDLILAAATVFEAFVERELTRVSAQAWEDETEYEGEEEADERAWLEGLAVVGRAACSRVLPRLAQLLNECQESLSSTMRRGEDPSADLERLCWVVSMSGLVLADAGDGETPMVPIAVIDACVDAERSGRIDPVESLSWALLNLGDLCVRHAGEPVISAALLQHVGDTLGRWAETYLLIDDAPSSTLAAAFSARERVLDVAHRLVQLSLVSLTNYFGERALHKGMCVRLLAPLCRRKDLCSILMHCTSWHELHAAVAGQAAGIQVLDGGVQRQLLQSLVLAASGFEDITQMGHYLSSLLHPLVRLLTELSVASRRAEPKPVQAYNIIQSLRGAARGVNPLMQPIVYAHLESIQPALLRLMTSYQGHPIVYTTALKLGADIVEYHASALTRSQTTTLFRWAIELSSTYASHRTSASNLVAEQALEEACLELCALLRLLLQLTNSEAPEKCEVAVALFTALEGILPHIKEEHLRVPKLQHAFFAVLAHGLEAYAAHVATLSKDVFERLLQGLCFGMKVRGDPETEAAVFEAAAALAKHNWLKQGAGAVLNVQMALSSLVEALLWRVLVDDSGFEVVDYAAEAALPLWLGEPSAVEQSMTSLAGLVGDDSNAITTFTAAFREMDSAARQASQLDRQSRQRFHGAFKTFIFKVRGMVKKR